MKIIKKLLYLLLSAAMLAGLLPAFAVPVRAAALPVTAKYLDSDGETERTATAVKVTTDSTTWEPTTTVVGISLTKTNYLVVNASVTISERVTVEGDMNLILYDGCTLTAEKGITVLEGNSLTIWGQSKGTGALNATAGLSYQAGIGGLTENETPQAVGSITINGGKVTATGGRLSAGIGGGAARPCGTVTINRGTVTATGGTNGGAGIGSGFGDKIGGGTVVINGGVVNAVGVDNAPGIGSDNNTNTVSITLNWTKDTDRITASSFKGDVTLAKPFAASDKSAGFATGSAGSNTLTKMAGKTLIPARNITFETTDNGTVKADRTPAVYAKGETVTLTVTPDKGYVLTDTPVSVKAGSNSVDVAGSGSTYTFTMPSSDVTVSASFELPSYEVMITNTGNGSVTASAVKAKKGESVTLTVEPAEKCSLESLNVTYKQNGNEYSLAITQLVNHENKYQFVMPDADVTVTAAFTQTLWKDLQQKLNNGGTVTLTENIEATSADTALVIPNGVTVTLDLNGCTLDRGLKEATQNGSVIIVEGGGSLTLADSSTDGTGKVTGGYTSSFGGGVFVEQNSEFTMSGGYISGNSASGYGGGVFVLQNSEFTMSGGSISQNSASSEGGGVEVYKNGKFTMSGGSISQNSASYYGGGVFVESNGTFTMSGGYIDKNSAGTTGGGVYVDENGTFTMSGGYIDKNSASSKGGGVFVNETGTFTMSGGYISGSSAGDGGNAVYNYSDEEFHGTVTLSDTVYAGTAIDGTDAGVVDAEEAAESINDYGYLRVEPCLAARVTANSTTTDYYSNQISEALAAWNDGGAGAKLTLLANVFTDSPITVTGGTEEAPMVLDLNGFTIDRGLTEETDNGSVIRVNNGGSLTLTDSSENKTGKVTGGNTTGNGGGVYVDLNGDFTMSGGSISQNSASNHGGGVYVYSNGTFTMTGGSISQNSASSYGGGVFVEQNSEFTMSGGYISQNSAFVSGGVYVSLHGNFTMSGGYISGNNASIHGGGVYVRDSAKFTMSGGYISQNSATYEGNAVYNDNGTVTLSDTVYAGTAIDGTNAAVVSAETAASSINNYGYLLVTQAPAFSTVQAILGSQIGMKFYMVIPDDYIGDIAPSVTFTVGTGGSAMTVEGTLQDDGRYMFTCGVSSLEMADNIHAVYTYTDGDENKTITEDISVKDYLSVLINNSAYSAAAPLAKAIWNYGYYAQQGLAAGAKHVAMTDRYTSFYDDSVDFLVSELEGYPINVQLGSDATEVLCSVSLTSETKLNIYLKPVEGVDLSSEGVTVTALKTGTTFSYDVEKRGDWYRVVIKDISAHELGDEFRIETTGGTIVTASALSYVQQLLSESTDQTVKNAAAALYAYYVKSIEYLNSLNS